MNYTYKMFILINLGEGTFSTFKLEVLYLLKFSKYVHELLFIFIFNISRSYTGVVIMDYFSFLLYRYL